MVINHAPLNDSHLHQAPVTVSRFGLYQCVIVLHPRVDSMLNILAGPLLIDQGHLDRLLVTYGSIVHPGLLLVRHGSDQPQGMDLHFQ